MEQVETNETNVQRIKKQFTSRKSLLNTWVTRRGCFVPDMHMIEGFEANWVENESGSRLQELTGHSDFDTSLLIPYTVLYHR